jgi:putative ABC transport system substrate-binding protein
MKHIGTYASKVVGTTPDVIFAASPPVVAALKRETRTIPIVFTNITDPVGVGIVQSLSHPGGNVTGFGAYEFAIAGKWVEVLKQIAPATTRIYVVKMPQHATNAKLFEAAKTVGASINVDVLEANIRTQSDTVKAIDAAAGVGSALMVLPSPATTDQHHLIIQLAVQHKLPAIFPYRDLAEGGGLVSYGPNVSEDYRSAASYVDRILKGERPSDLPVQAPAKFELIINLKTAKALGLTISPSLLARADEVIEQ